MTKRGVENKLVVVLFLLVLVIFSFAERDSKKLERLYTSSQVLQKARPLTSDVAAQKLPGTAAVN